MAEIKEDIYCHRSLVLIYYV